MPYRYAHLILALLLAPLIVIAFWRDYFGVLPGASFAFHLHGLSAVAWLALVTAQSWSIHGRHVALHRKLGLATFAVVPVFTAGAIFVVHSMATKDLAGHPFYAAFGARLGLHDIVSTAALVAMVALGLRDRRRVGLHAGYMLATVLLVFPPIMARVPLPYPRDIHLGELLPIGLALILALRRRRDARPMVIVAAVLTLEIVLFHTIGATAMWTRAFRAIAGVPIGAIALVALAIGGASLSMLLAGWRHPMPRRIVAA